MSSDLTDQFRALGARDQRRPCKVGDTLAQLTKNEAAAVDAGLRSDDDTIRRGVKIWLAKKGHALSSAAIGSHRADTCTCTSRADA